jgi:hypothetical protein
MPGTSPGTTTQRGGPLGLFSNHGKLDCLAWLAMTGKRDRNLLRPRQNKKYRCAIGSLSAGSQVSSTPSAVTA